MADDNQAGTAAGATPAPGATPQTDQTPASPAAPATDAPELGEAGKVALDRERAARQDADKRAKAMEKELEQLRSERKAAEDAKLSDQERLTKRIAELEQDKVDRDRELQERLVRSDTIVSASRQGFADPEDAFRLLDHSALEYDSDGKPKNLEKLLGDLLKAKPYLASAAARATGSAGGGVRGNGSGLPTFKESQLNDRGFWNANRQAIEEAIRDGRVVRD